MSDDLSEEVETVEVTRAVMVRQLELLRGATIKDWQHAVFRAVVGAGYQDVDWDESSNHVGYFLWARAFSSLASSLVEEGIVRVDDRDGLHVLVVSDRVARFAAN